MTDPSEAFFDKLRVVGRVPALARVNGTLRLELADGRRTEKTQITVHRGHITVGPPEGEADCMVAAQRKVWDALVTGEAQPLTAYLRGALAAAGDAGMLVAMRRLFAVAGVPEMASGRPRLISPSNTGGRAARPSAGRARGAAAAPANRATTNGAMAKKAKTTNAAQANRPATATRSAKATRTAGSRAAAPPGTAGRAVASSTTRATKARTTTAKKATTAATSRKGRA